MLEPGDAEEPEDIQETINQYATTRPGMIAVRRRTHRRPQHRARLSKGARLVWWLVEIRRQRPQRTVIARGKRKCFLERNWRLFRSLGAAIAETVANRNLEVPEPFPLQGMGVH